MSPDTDRSASVSAGGPSPVVPSSASSESIRPETLERSSQTRSPGATPTETSPETVFTCTTPPVVLPTVHVPGRGADRHVAGAVLHRDVAGGGAQLQRALRPADPDVARRRPDRAAPVDRADAGVTAGGPQVHVGAPLDVQVGAGAGHLERAQAPGQLHVGRGDGDPRGRVGGGGDPDGEGRCTQQPALRHRDPQPRRGTGTTVGHLDLDPVEQLLGGVVQGLDPGLQLLEALDGLDGHRAGGVADLDPRGRPVGDGNLCVHGHDDVSSGGSGSAAGESGVAPGAATGR